MTQVIELLSSRNEALSSNLNAALPKKTPIIKRKRC
jgi:hypothetical protein